MDGLYDYIFHYNHFTNLWAAIPRDKYNEYWNNIESESILKSKSIETLIILINKGNEFINSIE